MKYFCDAASTENFSKTAQKFNVPASNISQCVKRLENELGIKLFIRKSNKITLSDAGARFYTKVRKAISLIEDAKVQIAAEQISEPIKICITANRRIVMNAIEKFRRIAPGTTIEISHAISGDDALYDIIIADECAAKPDFEQKLIVSEEIMLAIKKDNSLATKPLLSAEDISRQELVSMNKESNMYSQTKKICNSLGFEPNIVIFSEDPFYVRKCVELGLGIAFFPSLSWQGQFSENIAIRHFGSFRRNTYAYWSKSANSKDAVRKFIELLCEEGNITQ